eukprot:7378004-Prymnesium_polylepis.3
MAREGAVSGRVGDGRDRGAVERTKYSTGSMCTAAAHARAWRRTSRFCDPALTGSVGGGQHTTMMTSKWPQCEVAYRI